MTRLPTIEAINVLACVPYVSSTLAFVSAEVGFIPSFPLLYYLTLPFLSSRARSSDFLGFSHISLSVSLISEKVILLKIDMSCNIIKNLDVIIVSKVYAQVLLSTWKRANYNLDPPLVS